MNATAGIFIPMAMRNTAAATLIQAFVRKVIAIRTISDLRSLRNSAAIRIQAAVRKSAAIKRYAKIQALKQRHPGMSYVQLHNLAKRTQSSVRIWLATIRASKIRALKLRYKDTPYHLLHCSGSIIQAFFQKQRRRWYDFWRYVYHFGNGIITPDGIQIAYDEDGVGILGVLDEHDQLISGRFIFGKFIPADIKKDAAITLEIAMKEEELYTQTKHEQAIVADSISMLREKQHNRDASFWSMLDYLKSLLEGDEDDELQFKSLCKEFKVIYCNYGKDCRKPRCTFRHPVGTDCQANHAKYKASSKRSPSSSSTVVSDITDDGNSSGLLINQPTTDSSNFDAKAEEFISRPSVTEALGESCSKENLLEYLDSDEGDFSALVESFKVPDRIKLKALRKLRLSPQAAIETKSSAPVEPKSTAPPQQVGGGAIQSTYCKNWQKTGTCYYNEKCHNKAFHVTKATKPSNTATPCHNKAFRNGKDCDWLPNCILCHDRTAPQAQPVAQVQDPAPPPAQPQAHVQVQAPEQPPTHPQEHAQVQAPAQPPTHPQEHAQVQDPAPPPAQPQAHVQVQAPEQPPTHPQENAQVQDPTKKPKRRR
jgi:hypothetical protein